MKQPPPSKIHLTDDEMLERIPESTIRAAEELDALLIYSDSTALVWLQGRCVLSVNRKNDSTEGFHQKVDVIFKTLSGELDEDSSKSSSTENE
jgi:hypothetical protein